MKRISMLAVLAATVWAAVGGGVAFGAASVHLCVGEEAGSPVRSGGATGSCKPKETPVALPSSEAEQQTLLSILPHVKYTESGVGGKPTVQFSGVNVQVVNGAGSTYANPNGEGNLVIGYNALPKTQTGSHDLVVGDDHGFSGSGSVVFGIVNNVLGDHEFAAGTGNTASGDASFVSGYDNEATGQYSSVSGGKINKARGSASWIGGGLGNTAAGNWSSISGGANNTTSEGHWF